MLRNALKAFYPFKDIKLDRADVEWLLSTHESEGEVGPVAWPPPSDPLDENPFRLGIDLRGAVLATVDLSELPLTRVMGGLEDSFFPDATPEQRDAAAIDLEGANLFKCQLQEAELIACRLQGAFLQGADLESAYLSEVVFDEADLQFANVASATFFNASFKNARLNSVKASSAHFDKADLEQADFQHAILQKAHLGRVQAEYANFTEAELQQADLEEADLGAAMLASSHLEGANLNSASLAGTVLSGAFFDGMTKLNYVTLSNFIHGTAQIGDVHWGDVNVAVIDWASVPDDISRPLMDAWKRVRGSMHDRLEEAGMDLHRFDLEMRMTALRANRQLAVVLRTQGLNQDANRFAYRAQVLQRQVLWRQRKWSSALGLLALELVSGYGYKPLRAGVTYAFVIAAFMGLYLLNAQFSASAASTDAASFRRTSISGIIWRESRRARQSSVC